MWVIHLSADHVQHRHAYLRRSIPVFGPFEAQPDSLTIQLARKVPLIPVDEDDLPPLCVRSGVHVERSCYAVHRWWLTAGVRGADSGFGPVELSCGGDRRGEVRGIVSVSYTHLRAH